jgi:hypothetical protein
MLNDVGTPVAIISQLNTLPAGTPLNASMAASRLATHDSGPGWIATPYLYDSDWIHDYCPAAQAVTSELLLSIGLERRTILKTQGNNSCANEFRSYHCYY